VFQRDGYDRIDAVDTPDPLTAVVHFREIYAAFLTLFEHVLPRHLLSTIPDVNKSDYARRPVGTGPFKITEFAAGDHVTMERNTAYRRPGLPLLDRIIVRFIPSRDAALLQLKAGEVDAMFSLTEQQAVEVEKSQELRLLTGPSSNVFRLEFNLAKPGTPADPQKPHAILSDIAMRRALTLATPKQQIITSLLAGRAEVANSILAIGWAAPKDLRQESYDPAKAKDVLDRAGWTPGNDGIRQKAGVRASLTISAPTNDPVRERMEQVLIDEWKTIGVELKIRNFPTAVLFAADGPVRQGDFDIDTYAEAILIDPHARLASRYTTKSIPTAANRVTGLNWNRYATPEMDRLIERAAVTVDQKERAAIYRQLLQIVNDAYLNVWLYTQQNIDAFRSNVGGYGRSNPWMTFGWDAENWYVQR
jgi:peptide/nickel transport system substrate-binding protein